MKLSHLCIVTDDVPRLRDFYSNVLKTKCDNDDPNPSYVEFVLGEEGAVLAIYSYEKQKQMFGNLSEVKTNRNVWLEFQVDDVEAEYNRLKALGVEIIKDITVQPWGNKSFYFRDPEGNPISFYEQVFETE